MAKQIDKAGMWNIKGNPITHDGVVFYSGKAIDATGQLGLDPNKLYPVYRPMAELLKACESFNGKPLINNHEMIGTDGNLTKPDDKNIGGTIYNVRPSQDVDGAIIADMTIFSEELQNAIESGKVELSLGYWCKYRKEDGEFNGQHYDFVQCDLEGNHIALVDHGRMGSGVRVFDHTEKTLVYDSMEMPTMEKKTTDTEELREEIVGLLKDATDEVLAKCKDLLTPAKETDEDPADPAKTSDEDGEKKEGDNTEDPAKSEKDEDKDGEGKDTDEPKKADGEDEEGKKSEKDEEPAKKEGEDEEGAKKAEDSAPTMKQMLAEFAKRESLYRAVEPHTGAFDHDDMTAKDVAVYAAERMGIAAVDGAEVACVENYLSGLGKANEISVAQDSSVGADGFSDAMVKFLGE